MSRRKRRNKVYGKKLASASRRRPGRSLIKNHNNDYHNFAGEYRAREVEFGHGRAKSKEWNTDRARELKRGLRELRQLRRDDPNLFDRGAMK